MRWHHLPLPDEIMVEILSRLPVKSLLRLRCVCKPWLSLFSSPSFIQLHLNHHRPTTALNRTAAVDGDDDDETLIVHRCDPKSGYGNIRLLKTRNPNPTFTLAHPFPDNQCDMDLVGSINCLVCLSRKADGSILILWNPATREYRNLPPPNINFVPNEGRRASIGFCFDSVRNDYKIVRIVWLFEELGFRPLVELYSVSTDCWREIEVEVPVNVMKSKCDTIVKGEPYWSAYYYGDPFVEVVWFDVGNEVFHTAPSLGLPNVFLGGLVDFENSLAMLADKFWLPSGEMEEKVSLWVMEDCSSWSLKFVAEPSFGMRPMGCSKNGKIVLETATEVLLLYDLKTKESKCMDIESKGLAFQVSNYTASLVPIRGSKQVGRED